MAFPSLDRAVITDAVLSTESKEVCVDVLLFLTRGDEDPISDDCSQRRIRIEDHDHFPCLLDSNGWQVADPSKSESSLSSTSYLATLLKPKKDQVMEVDDEDPQLIARSLVDELLTTVCNKEGI